MSRILREQLQDLQGISCMFIYGSFAAGKAHAKSDIDLFVVGNVSDDELISIISDTERQLGREINYTLMSDREYRERQQVQDPFVMNVLKEPRVILAGCND